MDSYGVLLSIIDTLIAFDNFETFFFPSLGS